MKRNEHLSREDQIYLLRDAWDSRVTHDFCITSEDAEAWLTRVPGGVILQTFTHLGKFLKSERTERLMFYDEAEIMELLEKFLNKEIADRERSKESRAATLQAA
jgi:hypothetical protein